MSFDIVHLEPNIVAVARRVTSWSELPAAIAAAMKADFGPIRALQDGHNVFVYRPRPGGTVELGCGFEVGAPFEPVGEIVCDHLPGGEAAHAVHIGPYHELGSTWTPLLAWIRDQGRSPLGPQWEVYGDWEEDPARLRTDIYVLLA